MTKEQKKAIKVLEQYKNECIEEYKVELDDKKNIDEQHASYLHQQIEAVYIILNLIQEQEAELQKKDDIVRRVINRLNNDIKRIRKARAKNYYNDYRRCRLKAYKTKTREIKEYIEEQYFERKVEN